MPFAQSITAFRLLDVNGTPVAEVLEPVRLPSAFWVMTIVTGPAIGLSPT
jgi:hypothetical protein